jgi:aldose 1-epimerase
MKIEKRPYGKTSHGMDVDLFTISSSSGSVLQITNFGAIITQVNVQNRDGMLHNVNLGFETLDGYLGRHPFFGATVGRFCNRIAGGRFALDGRHYQLDTNKSPNHIHGGPVGFDKKVWQAEPFTVGDHTAGVRFQLTSPDGDQGYPGTLQATAEYSWSETNDLTCTFAATTDKPTIVNMTNHAYWNLSGAGSGVISDHLLQMDCDRFLEVDQSLIPTGKILDVAGTPLDFRQYHRVGSRLEQLPDTKGYDHCYVINGQPGQLRIAARLQEPTSGRTMEVWTTQPGVQLYTGNHLSGDFGPHSGLCLETQHYPDSPNQPDFPTTRLNPGERFQETTLYRFGIL